MIWQIGLAFFVSGFAGLMHEIVWSKLLASLIGTTAHAQAAVLVVYMGGLALGSVIYGRRSDRRGRSLRTYMYLEVGIAAYCAGLPLFLSGASELYVWAASYVFESSQLKFVLRFALALLTIIVPAIMMGGTLPLLARHFILHPGQTRARVAALYALNNFGAVAGAAVAGFVTLPGLGVYPSLVIASGMNLVAAVLVLPHIAEGRDTLEHETPNIPVEKTAPVRGYSEAIYGATLVSLLLSGFAAMAYEVVFIRVISLSFGATTFSFTVMLMSFIAGIGLGSLIVMQIRVERPLWLLGVCQLVAAVAFLAATPLMARLPYYVGLVRISAHEAGDSFLLYQLGKAALCLVVLLVPTMCLGASFPLVTAIQARQPHRIGSLVGATYACNTVGNVLGVLVTTLFLLPGLGMLGSFHVAIALSFASGLVVLVVATEAPISRRAFAASGAVVALAVYASNGLDWPTPILHSFNHLRMRSAPSPDKSAEEVERHPASSFESWKRYFLMPEPSIVQIEEESHASVMVADSRGILSLVVNTKTDASTALIDMETQVLLAHLPLFLQPDARDLLVVGYGSGISLGSAMTHPVQRADLVEISGGVMDVDPAFAPHNYNVLSDPRVHVYVDDAQSFLRTVPRTYDAVICQPSNPWISGIAGLFTTEFFELARSKMNPGGVFTLWFQAYEQSEEGVQLILRTFQAVFPHITLFVESNYNDILAVGSVEALPVDFVEIEDRFDLPDVRNDLARIGISNVMSLLSHHAVPPDVVPTMLGSGPVNSTLRQYLEYISIRAKFVGTVSELIQENSLFLLDDGRSQVDRYTEFRAGRGEPVTANERELAAEHMSTRSRYREEHTSILTKRADARPADSAPATRPSRGAVLAPRDVGRYEASMWAQRFKSEGDTDRGRAYTLRLLSLGKQGKYR